MNTSQPLDRHFNPSRRSSPESKDRPEQKPDSYRDIQDARDREYRAAWKAMSPEERADLAAAGIKGPLFHESGQESLPKATKGSKLPKLHVPATKRDGVIAGFEGPAEEDSQDSKLGAPKPEIVPVSYDQGPEPEEEVKEDYDALLPTIENGLRADLHRIMSGVSPNVSTRALGAKWGVSPAAVCKAALRLESYFHSTGIPMQRPTARGLAYRDQCRNGKIRFYRERDRNAAVAEGRPA